MIPPFNRPLGTAPGEAFGPQPETFWQRHARVIRWVEDALAVGTAIGCVAFVAAYLFFWSV